MGYESIPMELRILRGWVSAAQDKVPLNPRTGQPADTTNPDTWGTFEEACSAGYKHIGFVFCSRLWPYAGIDLDNPRIKKVGGATIPNDNAEEVAEIEARHAKIGQIINSYTELSCSGTGVHIIVRGKIPAGVRKDRVEIYSDARYFIFSGDVLNNAPITDYQDLLDEMYAGMTAGNHTSILVEEASTITDNELTHRAWNAENAEKFQRLWGGSIDGYPSQSEADYALISMLCFYTPSNEQVRRLFRMSLLGQRDKANNNDVYLDRAIGKIRGRQDAETLPMPDISGLLAKHMPVPPPPPMPVQIVSEPESVFYTPTEIITPPSSSIIFPPGLIGEMASYIYSSAPRPVPEISLIASLGFAAGFLGRQFNISNTGLNQYLILLASTGTGKEYTSTGIDMLIANVRQQIPQADEFIGPGTFASGQALTRTLDKHNCFVSIMNEFGLTLQQVCDKNAGSHHVQLKKVWLDLFSKSGKNSILRPSVYSDSEKNTGLVKAPCVSILGESTPSRFYDVLDSGHILEGLLSRFLVMEYLGLRPSENPNAFHSVPERLKQELLHVLQAVLAMKYNDQFCAIPIDESGKRLLNDFNLFCDEKINGGDDELTKQLWNRAHLKAIKLAGLVAAGCAVHRPIVTGETAQWAIDLVTKDVSNMCSKFVSGDIGKGDHKCEADIMKAVNKYPSLTESQRASYNVPAVLRGWPQAIPFVFLKKYCAMRSSFKDDRRGAVVALDVALKDLLKSGILQQIPAPAVKAQWGTDSPVYYRGESWQ